MTIYANGQAREVGAGTSVTQLIEELKLVPNTILVERNGEVVLKSEWKKTFLCEEDRLEFLKVVAGG